MTSHWNVLLVQYLNDPYFFSRVPVGHKSHKPKSRGRTRGRAPVSVNDDCMELSGAEFTSSSPSVSSNESDPGFFTTDEGREGECELKITVQSNPLITQTPGNVEGLRYNGDYVISG